MADSRWAVVVVKPSQIRQTKAVNRRKVKAGPRAAAVRRL